MCGIAGIYNYRSAEPVSGPRLREMTEILAHRGPDGSGYYAPTGSPAGLGHRRLAIIDLQTGDQPMQNEDGSVWITFNGEIYNYRELRQYLRQKGHQLKTESDTEVIVHAYEEWGDACPSHLNGIFAFAIWDARNRRLFLARDHFGVKPLYYHDSGSAFLFASELKSILLEPSVPRRIDLDALSLCLRFRHTPSPWTLFDTIRKIPPGCFLSVSHAGVKTGSFAGDPREIDRTRSERQWIDDLRERYQEAVRSQMVSDVPIGLSLSSGVDSNTVLALMSRVSPAVLTFTVGFEGGERRDDEIPKAVAAARQHAAVPASRVINEEDYLSFLEKYLWHLEEPIGNESAAAYYFVAKLAQGRVKVLLSGQGADEPFAGYSRHIAARFAPLIPGGLGVLASTVPLEKLPFSSGSEAPRRIRQYLRAGDELERLLGVYSITTPQELRLLFDGRAAKAVDWELPRRYLASQLTCAPPGTLLERMTFIDARTSLSDNLLLCGDKMAMAASIEMRVPFLDRTVMEIAERIPGRLKVKGFRGKAIHKRVCESWLPKSHVYRRKIGFNNPMKLWLTQRLEGALRDLIAQPDSVSRTLLNVDYVNFLLEKHKTGAQDYQRLLFLLLSIETWRNVFVKGETRGSP